MKRAQKRIYLDYASATPLRAEARRAMERFFDVDFGNPSSLYEEGVAAKHALAGARQDVARLLGVKTEEVVFTSGGTEANNLALRSVAELFKGKPAHIITTTVEHPSILETCRALEKEGVAVTYLSVDEHGLVAPESVGNAITQDTVLVSIMYVNNEIGTIQPIRDIVREVTRRKTALGIERLFVHTDAAQAGNYLTLKVQSLGVDMMTLDAAKVYGPKGVGALFVRSQVALTPVLFGGGQEKGIRPGTENIAGIVGFAAALSAVQEESEKETARLTSLRDYAIEAILERIPGACLNGDMERRIANNINICIPGLDAEFAVMQLDAAGIACSSASACKNLSDASYSYVIEALGTRGEKCKESSLRFTLGNSTTKREIDTLLSELARITPLHTQPQD